MGQAQRRGRQNRAGLLAGGLARALGLGCALGLSGAAGAAGAAEVAEVAGAVLQPCRVPGIRIYEVGISYYGRTYEEGKKIGWKDAFRALYCILKYNIWARK